MSQGQRREGLNLQAEGQQRLQREQLQKQANTFATDLKDTEKSLAEQEASLGAVKAALSSKSKPAQSVVENFLLRSVAGEKGPLSDNDRSSFAAKAGFNSVQNAINYFTGVPSSNWTDDQRAAFQDLVGVAESKMEANKAQRIGDILGRSDFLLGLSKDANGKALIDKTAKKYGFERQGEGFTKKVSEKKVSMNNETPVSDMVSVIKDPAMKAQAQAALAKYEGKAVPKVLLDRIKAAAQEQ